LLVSHWGSSKGLNGDLVLDIAAFVLHCELVCVDERHCSTQAVSCDNNFVGINNFLFVLQELVHLSSHGLSESAMGADRVGQSIQKTELD